MSRLATTAHSSLSTAYPSTTSTATSTPAATAITSISIIQLTHLLPPFFPCFNIMKLGLGSFPQFASLATLSSYWQRREELITILHSSLHLPSPYSLCSLHGNRNAKCPKFTYRYRYTSNSLWLTSFYYCLPTTTEGYESVLSFDREYARPYRKLRR